MVVIAYKIKRLCSTQVESNIAHSFFYRYNEVVKVTWLSKMASLVDACIFANCNIIYVPHLCP